MITILISNIPVPKVSGRLAIDLSNNTFNIVDGAELVFAEDNYKVSIPPINPLERVVIITPKDIYNRPLITQVYILYKGEKYLILDEYYSLSGDMYNSHVRQVAKVKVTNTEVKSISSNIININLRPYIRKIDITNT